MINLDMTVHTVAEEAQHRRTVAGQIAKAQERREMLAKAAAPIVGTVGEMTGIINGLEDFVSDDIPLFGWRQ